MRKKKVVFSKSDNLIEIHILIFVLKDYYFSSCTIFKIVYDFQLVDFTAQIHFFTL